MNKLFERVVELCKEKGISQRQLQIELGMSIGSLSKWKTSMPGSGLLKRAADYFNVSTDYLVGNSPYRNDEHMLQCFDENFQPDMSNTMIPEGAVQTDEGIIVPMYIEPETREIAEQLQENEKLTEFIKHLYELDDEQIDALMKVAILMKSSR